jgi:hypothetical protein
MASGGLNKDATIVRWSYNTPQVPYYEHLANSKFDYLCFYIIFILNVPYFFEALISKISNG